MPVLTSDFCYCSPTANIKIITYWLDLDKTQETSDELWRITEFGISMEVVSGL